MDKVYNFKQAEEIWYKFWEENGYFKPEINPDGKPYTIVLPPPNASGKMHTGNVLMIAIEDLLIRYHRMKGYSALWLPGTDHAGFETQITFERELKKQGKSRFSFSRQEFYDQVSEFVKQNRALVDNQIRQMGASVDWSRYKFTLDQDVLDLVTNTFKKMIDDGLVYRDEYLVNYCVSCGTTFADLEIDHIEREDPLYYIKYPLVNRQDGEPEHLEVATVRPEPIMIDKYLAVNPNDKKMNKYAGRKVLNPLTDVEMEIFADEFVDPEFGTGLVKLTPGHDRADYEVAKKLGLEIVTVIDWNGKMTEKAGKYSGLKVKEARQQIVDALTQKGLLDPEKINHKYLHSIPVCYKGGHEIEQIPLPNWFVKVDDKNKSFKKPALEAVKKGQIKIYPKWQEITYTRWMEDMRDWPISRQTVWGIRIPVWYKIQGNETKMFVIFLDKKDELKQLTLDQALREKYPLDEIENGLQRLFVLGNILSEDIVISQDKPEGETDYLPETDTFDTWFSSGQWPLATLGYPNSEDYKKFYPTQVLETGWEIIRFWVSRMIMFGIYLDPQNRPPFENVYLHGLVRAIDGRKMSKSLGNVINPEEYMEEFGVDALRMGLISGTANGKDFAFPRDRVVAYKHFSNKIWNMARFMLLMGEENSIDLSKTFEEKLEGEDEEMYKKYQALTQEVDQTINKFRFADAGELIYQFMWHEIADKYIEYVKNKEDKQNSLLVLKEIYVGCLKLLHPFMPYVTEEIYQKIPGHEKSIMIAKWPAVS